MSAVVSLVGYIILDTISTTNTSVLYFAMFLCTIGVSISTSRYVTMVQDLLMKYSATGLPSNSYRFSLASFQYSQPERSRYDQWPLYRRGELCWVIVKQYLHAEGGS